MVTMLVAGTAFRVKRSGEWQYGRVSPDGKGWTGAGTLAPGEVVHDAVWKGDSLESRKVRVVASVDYKPIFEEMADTPLGVVDPAAALLNSVFGMTLRNVVVDGHPVMVTGDVGTDVSTGHGMWSWRDGPATPKAVVDSWSPEQLQAHCRAAVVAMHAWFAALPSSIPCGICTKPKRIAHVTFTKG